MYGGVSKYFGEAQSRDSMVGVHVTRGQRAVTLTRAGANDSSQATKELLTGIHNLNRSLLALKLHSRRVDSITGTIATQSTTFA